MAEMIFVNSVSAFLSYLKVKNKITN